MPVKKNEEGMSAEVTFPREMSIEDAYNDCKAKLDEAEKVIETLNERLAKVIRLYNTVADLYIQGK